MPKKPKFYAMLHDGNFEGDSSYYFPGSHVPFDGEALPKIIEKYKTKLAKDYDGMKFEDSMRLIEEEWKEDGIRPCGAVIISSDIFDIISQIWDASDPGGDSAVYRTNRICKVLAWKLKVKNLGKGMK